MSHRAGGAGASRHGTSAAKAPQCAGSAVLLRWHGRYAGATRSGDASKAIAAGHRRYVVGFGTLVAEVAA